MTTFSRRMAVFLCVTAAVTTSCRPERASVEDLYTSRMLALGYLQRNQLAEAEAEFNKLIKLAPDDPFAYANLGLAYLQAGRYKEAEKQLDKAHDLEPTNTDVDLALARLYSLTQREPSARETLERLRRDSPGNARALYALSELDARESDEASVNRRLGRLRELLAASPANLAVRMDLISALFKRNESDSVVRQLEEVRRIPPELPVEARMYVDSAIQSLRAGNITQSRITLGRLVERIQVTAPYQASLADVKWSEGPLVGRPILTFAPKGFVSRNGVRTEAAIDVTAFADATEDIGLGSSGDSNAFAVGDIDGDGDDDVLLHNRVYLMQNGSIRDSTGAFSSAQASYSTLADFDNDGWLDVFAIGRDGLAHLYRNRGNASFEDVSSKASLPSLAGASKAIFVDLDHDGDLDILVAGAGPCRLFRNNLDGSFTEAAASFGFAGVRDTRDATVGDFDGDGRIDVFFAAATDVLMLNHGAQRFLSSNGAPASSSSAVATADYDNDGFLDIVASGKNGLSLMHSRGDGTFTADRRSSLKSASAIALSVFDYDNDGWLDIISVGSSGASLNRNDGTGKFVDRSSLMPSTTKGSSSITISDVDVDGDEDIWLSGGDRPRLIRNNGGNSNLAVNVELKALRTGSGKNNTLGVGAKLELRAGKIFQTRVATSRVTHFGLGPHLKADVLRVEWPNGVPQTVYFPGADQDVVESETLKGSCALAYTWDGKQFRFATDAMWRSALGMPLGLMGGTSAFAPAGASQEYLRIDGNALKPKDGRYFLQLTEELWETAYADEVKLIAVDHPDSIDVFVDERFVPPGPVDLRLFQVPKEQLPLSAIDERGTNVLDALREVDDIYVSNFVPTRYQGIVESHDLIMDLGPDAGNPGTSLFLRGWIYPTDASINVALAQQSSINISSPSLEVRDARGKWRTAIANIGFPSGKDKTLVIDLSGKFPTSDHRVRIRTSMQIYWDKAFVAKTLADNPVRITKLDPVAAELHYRGFSRMYRKGGRYGPYWFAYDDVTKTSPWRPIEGNFTRFGDVLSLLKSPDDMYVVMGPGDEATIQFDAGSARSIPKGWKRDFLLYTDGWIKDSDLNTAYGTTVGPLPFHSLKSYPYGPNEKYPADAARDRYLREYNTRRVGGALKP